MNLKVIWEKIKVYRNSRVAGNSMILIISKVAQMVLSLLVSIISARFLGPDNFGIVSYASSIIVFFSPIANLGINSILAYEFIQKPEEEGTTIGTSLLLQLISGFLCMLGVATFVFTFDHNDPLVIKVVILYSIELVFQSVSILESWFQVHYQAKYVAASTLIAYISVSTYKIILLAKSARVEMFALSACVDYIMLGTCYFCFYKKAEGPKFHISFSQAKQLIHTGKSFILPVLMFAAYTQMDRIMLKAMMGERIVGFYTIALSLSTLLNFVFLAIITTSNPLILEYQKEDEGKFERALIGRFSLIFYVSLLLGTVLTLGSSIIVNILYGEVYKPSADILRILVWSPLFMYWGNAKSIWFVTQKKQKYLKWLSLFGVITNITLNYFLINRIGAMGAAIATVCSEMTVNFISGFFFPQVRKSSMMMLMSVNPKSLKYVKLLLE